MGGHGFDREGGWRGPRNGSARDGEARGEGGHEHEPHEQGSPDHGTHGHAEAVGRAAIRGRCAVITVSDTRTPETDRSGALLGELIAAGGHERVFYRIVPDEAAAIVAAAEAAVAAGAEVILLTGGTGVGPRDVTCEALEPLLTKRLPGFGELFRVLSHREIGSAAMLSRAFAGVFRGALLFALPGSAAAARLGAEALILPELSHALWQLRGGTT